MDLEEDDEFRERKSSESAVNAVSNQRKKS